MKILKITFLVLLFLNATTCKTEDETPVPSVSDEAQLLQLDLVLDGSVFQTSIAGTQITLSRPLPKGTTELSIRTIAVSEGATVDKAINNTLSLSQNPISIIVTAEDGISQKTYSLIFHELDYTSIVEKHGLLKVDGSSIVDENNAIISLAGNSFFWSNNGWGGERYYQPEIVSWLKKDWGTTIVRAAMGVEDPGGYLEFKPANKEKVKRIVDAAIDNGLYVIIDWHSHHAEDYPDEAVAFFEEMATLYGEYDNIIYEVYNEPLGVSWTNTIKPYAEAVIAAIRAIDPDNLIIVGTPEWSQRVDHAAADPITDYTNIAYTLHFYTVYHQQDLRDRATAAIAAGLPIFVTEWGSIGYTQNDPEAEKWIDWCREHNISHCNWSVHDKQEEWSILVPNASTTGSWSDFDLTQAGLLARKFIRSWLE